MVLKLTCLHLFNGLQLDLGHVVFIHVQQDVLDHDNTQFLIRPQLIQSLDKVVIRSLEDILSDWLQEFTSRGLDVVVKHLTVLVEDEVVRGTIELFVTELGRLF